MGKTIQDGKWVHAAVLDFSKAFDVLGKLQYYGIRAPLLNWFESLLTDRTQSVVCVGKCSNPSPLTSGVTRGKVLGPLLNLLYVSDLLDNLKPTLRLFTDETLLYSVIKTEVDGHQLQDDLRQLEVWQSKWQLVFKVIP